MSIAEEVSGDSGESTHGCRQVLAASSHRGWRALPQLFGWVRLLANADFGASAAEQEVAWGLSIAEEIANENAEWWTAHRGKVQRSQLESLKAIAYNDRMIRQPSSCG